jgi:hypothetical protein
MREPSVVEAPARYHPRVEASLMVKVVMGGRSSLAKAKDLSMAGLFLAGLRAKEGDRLAVTLSFPEDTEISAFCRVKRRHTDGVAVVFEDLDWDHLLALARYLHPRLP